MTLMWTLGWEKGGLSSGEQNRSKPRGNVVMQLYPSLVVSCVRSWCMFWAEPLLLHGSEAQSVSAATSTGPLLPLPVEFR